MATRGTRNQGTSFEQRIEAACAAYEKQGRAKIHKTDPPTITSRGRTRLKPNNPWLDFTGTWTEQKGRALIIEAKRTDEKPRLDIARHGGITERQWDRLREWRDAGACAFVLWERPTTADPFDTRILTLEIIEQALREGGRVSMPWHSALRIPRGTGYVRYDFLTAAEHLTI